MEYPEIDEFLIVKVKKMFPYGAICSLEEYGGIDGFIHISEVSSGWIRNIREHLKEGQVVVSKVTHIDHEKNQIDLSIKRVSESDKKRKLLLYQNEKRAVKLLERTAYKLGKTINQAYTEVGNLLIEDYGDIYSAFEALSKGEANEKIPKAWLPKLTEVAKAEIKEKKAESRALLVLQSFAPDGLEQVKKIISSILGQQYDGQIKIRYVSAPNYYIDVTAKDYKTADKIIAKIDAFAAGQAKPPVFNFSLQKQDKKS